MASLRSKLFVFHGKSYMTEILFVLGLLIFSVTAFFGIKYYTEYKAKRIVDTKQAIKIKRRENDVVAEINNQHRLISKKQEALENEIERLKSDVDIATKKLQGWKK